jgi:hypothetical protein
MEHNALERWLKGGHLDGVAYAPGAHVVLLEGDDAGAAGTVVALQSLAPEPLYTVELSVSRDTVAAVQSSLRPGE